MLRNQPHFVGRKKQNLGMTVVYGFLGNSQKTTGKLPFSFWRVLGEEEGRRRVWNFGRRGGAGNRVSGSSPLNRESKDTPILIQWSELS